MNTEQARAQRTTESMLAEIACGTAAEVVMAVRYANHPPGPTFVPALDDAIRPARGGEPSTIRRGDMVEIIGPSGSGKTTLALFLVLTRILPASITVDLPGPTAQPMRIPLGGRADHVTFLHPTSHRSPVLSLSRHLHQHISGHVLDALSAQFKHRHLTPYLAAQIKLAVRDSLRRLRVVRTKPRWKSLYLALLASLHPPSSRHEPEPTGGGPRRLDMVIVDGFADGFWPERWGMEDRPQERKPEGRVRRPEDVSLRDVMAALEAVRREMGAVVVLTLQGLWPQNGLYTPHLPAPYPSPFARDREDGAPRAWPLTIQITLTGRVASHQLPADITLIDALRTNGSLQTKGGEAQSELFEGVVRVPGADGVVGTAAGVKFEMHMGDAGVEVWT